MFVCVCVCVCVFVCVCVDWIKIVFQWINNSSFGYNYFHRSNITGIPSNGLSNTTPVLLQGWYWHIIFHESWYAIKQRSQAKPMTYNIYIYTHTHTHTHTHIYIYIYIYIYMCVCVCVCECVCLKIIALRPHWAIIYFSCKNVISFIFDFQIFLYKFFYTNILGLTLIRFWFQVMEYFF